MNAHSLHLPLAAFAVSFALAALVGAIREALPALRKLFNEGD